MGERGLISRLLSPKFGGYLTYGALEAGAISAPGQPTAKDLLDLYNFRLIKPDTKVYGIIGKPVGHSKSPLLFNAAFKKVGLNAVYVHLLVDDVEKFFNTYSAPDFISGCRYVVIHFLVSRHQNSREMITKIMKLIWIAVVQSLTRRLQSNAWILLTPLHGYMMIFTSLFLLNIVSMVMHD